MDHVHGVEPNRITVWICDDDGEHKPVCTVHIVQNDINIYYSFSKELLVHWSRDVYEFYESQVAATVELVTDSIFDVAQVSIQGFPRQIPDGDPNRIDSLVVPGPGTYANEVKQPSLCTLHI